MHPDQPIITALSVPQDMAGATWDQSSFHAFQAQRPPELVADDARKLRHIFNESSSPTFQKMVAWALDNGVVFFIDHNLQHAGAYYTMGTGAVGLNAKYADSPMQAAPLIGHEIRHAWQDKQGFMPTVGRDFAEYFMQIALMEADAFAFERLIGAEESAYWGLGDNWGITASDKDGDLCADPLDCETVNKQGVLRNAFKKWAFCRGGGYGDTATRYFGSQLGVPDITPRDFHMSFQPYQNEDKPHIKGIDVADIAKAVATGAAFEGMENYLDTPGMRAYLQKNLLNPDLAQKFYRASQDLPPLVAEVNKRFRMAQAGHRKKTGTDLYL